MDTRGEARKPKDSVSARSPDLAGSPCRVGGPVRHLKTC